MGAAFTGYLLDTEAQGQAQRSLWCPLSSPRGRSSCAEATPPAQVTPSTGSVTTHPFPAPAWPQSPSFQAFPGFYLGWTPA